MNRSTFFSKLKLNPLTGCMEWQGAMCGKYGMLRTAGVKYSAHRVAAFYAGLIPSARGAKGGLDAYNVLHRCDNPICCEPTHLFVGDHGANQADKVAKLRQSRGEAQGKSVLRADQVATLRVAIDQGVEHRVCARVLGVSESTVSYAYNGLSWSWSACDHDPELLAKFHTAQINKPKGNWATGERHGRSKVTDAQVDEMRMLHGAGIYGVDELATKYNIGREQASAIVNFKVRA